MREIGFICLLLAVTVLASNETFFTTHEIPECPPLYSCTLADFNKQKPYPPDCQYYIVCTGRNTYRLTKCLLGRHFSPLQEECINPTTALCPTCFVTATSTPSNATSTTADITTITEVQTTTMGYISTTVDITTTTTLEPTTTTTTTLEPTTSSPVVPTCPPTPTCGTFDDGIKKPYPPNCSQYILCQTMQEVITDCPDGEHFSPTSKKCMSIAGAACPLCNPSRNSNNMWSYIRGLFS